MFFDASEFAFTGVLQTHVEQIRAEAESILPFMHDWFESKLHDGGWQVYGLFNFPDGMLLAETAARCPMTTALIAEHIPTHAAAGFSLLKPRSHIRPHKGYGGGVLRCHLPLTVPEGDCALRVGSDVQRWRKGQCLVFDDTVEHEAWNLTDYPRIVLLADFTPIGFGKR